MIIVISTAPHYLLMVTAGPAGVSRLSRRLRLAMFAGRMRTNVDVVGRVGGLLGASAGRSSARFYFVGLRLSMKHGNNWTGPPNSSFTCAGSNPGPSLASGMCFSKS